MINAGNGTRKLCPSCHIRAIDVLEQILLRFGLEHGVSRESPSKVALVFSDQLGIWEHYIAQIDSTTKSGWSVAMYMVRFFVTLEGSLSDCVNRVRLVVLMLLPTCSTTTYAIRYWGMPLKRTDPACHGLPCRGRGTTPDFREY